MEPTYLKPYVLFIGQQYSLCDHYSNAFNRCGIELIYQRCDDNTWSLSRGQHVDIVILQAKYLDGIYKAFLIKLRCFYPKVGIMLMLEQDDEKNRVAALEIGVDNFLSKTISSQELQAKIHALHRRLQTAKESHRQVYNFQGYVVDLYSREVRDAEGKQIKNLTSGEFLLLKIFLEHSNRLLTREFLLDRVTRYVNGCCTRSIDIRVSRLRKKLQIHDLIETVYGEGYIFKL